MGKLIEVTFMSIDGVVDAPDIVQEAQRYFRSNEEHDRYQSAHLLEADALLLGRKTYEAFSQAYPAMAEARQGAPTDFVARMKRTPKYVASATLNEASWNATIVRGDVAKQVKRIKDADGKNLLKYGTGPLDLVLFGDGLVDRLCIVQYPFVLGHGAHLFDEIPVAKHMALVDVKRFSNGTVVLEYLPNEA